MPPVHKEQRKEMEESFNDLQSGKKQKMNRGYLFIFLCHAVSGNRTSKAKLKIRYIFRWLENRRMDNVSFIQKISLEYLTRQKFPFFNRTILLIIEDNKHKYCKRS